MEEQLSHNESFDDIVEGKGLRFIMLLAIESGVGKELTAESGMLIADILGKKSRERSRACLN